MSRNTHREQYEFATQHPHPGDDPVARLAHVVELFADTPADEWAVLATSNAYPGGGKTGLTHGDLRALAETLEALRKPPTVGDAVTHNGRQATVIAVPAAGDYVIEYRGGGLRQLTRNEAAASVRKGWHPEVQNLTFPGPTTQT